MNLKGTVCQDDVESRERKTLYHQEVKRTGLSDALSEVVLPSFMYLYPVSSDHNASRSSIMGPKQNKYSQNKYN